MGVDISSTAVGRARAKYPDVDFRIVDYLDLTSVGESFDLVVAMEVLSYLEQWKETLSVIAGMATYLYVTLYLPDDPIGYVKSFHDLRTEIQRHFVIETELVQDSDHVYILAKTRQHEGT